MSTPSTKVQFVPAKKHLGFTINFLQDYVTPKRKPNGKTTRTLIATNIVNPKFGKDGKMLTPRAYRAFSKLSNSKDSNTAKGAKRVVALADAAAKHNAKLSK